MKDRVNLEGAQGAARRRGVGTDCAESSPISWELGSVLCEPNGEKPRQPRKVCKKSLKVGKKNPKGPEAKVNRVNLVNPGARTCAGKIPAWKMRKGCVRLQDRAQEEPVGRPMWKSKKRLVCSIVDTTRS